MRILKKYKYYLIFLAIALVASGALGYYYLSDGDDSSKKYTYDESIFEGSKAIFSDDNALYSYIKKFGPKRTMSQLHSLSSEYGDCHEPAHRAGRMAYEINDDKAFQLCSAECHSGCYHGATEAYFKEKGTANLSQNLKVLCSSELNAFFSHQCLHGIGHGLMAWANYEIYDALAACDSLPKGQDSCWTGVFMENIVGGLAKSDIKEGDTESASHFTKYLSDDPQYPCTVVDDKYKGACYFLQTSRMVQLFKSDFKKIADACAGAPAAYQRSCFESMGRDVGGQFRNDPETAIRMCGYAARGSARIGCLIGAAQDTFWDPSGQDKALSFCSRLADKEEKEACYGIIFGRAPEVLSSSAELESFCSKVEKDYQVSCRARTLGQ